MTRGRSNANGTLLRLAGLSAIASGLLAIPMVATLLAMYGGFAVGSTTTALRLGGTNDAIMIAVYGLALPVVPVMHVLIRETGTARSLMLAVTGAAGIVITMVLQWLLVTKRLAFEQEIAPVSAALLAVGAWMIGTGTLARRTGFLPNGRRNGIAGALYFGYPIWALNLGRGLLRARES